MHYRFFVLSDIFVMCECSTQWLGSPDTIGFFTRTRWEKELPSIKTETDELLISFIDSLKPVFSDSTEVIVSLALNYHWSNVTLTMYASDDYIAPYKLSIDGGRWVRGIPVLYYSNDNRLNILSKEENNPSLVWQILSKNNELNCKRKNHLKIYEKRIGCPFCKTEISPPR